MGREVIDESPSTIFVQVYRAVGSAQFLGEHVPGHPSKLQLDHICQVGPRVDSETLEGEHPLSPPGVNLTV